MSNEPGPLFTPNQRKLVGTAVGLAALVGSGWLLYLLLAGVARFISTFTGVIWPLAVAGITALILRPVVALFERRLKISRPVAVVLLYGAVALLLTALLFSFAPSVIDQARDFYAYLPLLWQNTLAWGDQHFPEWIALVRSYLAHPAVKAAVEGLSRQGQDLLGQVAPSLLTAGKGLFGVFGFIASLAVIPVYLFFFLQSDEAPAKSLPEHLPFLRPEHRDDVVFLVNEFIGILVAFFRGQLLIGLIMGALFALGFSLAGLKFGLALGLMTGLLNIVPYLGSILGLSVALPLALFQPDGGLPLVGVCLAVFAAVQMLDGWLLTPRIMGRQTGLHPVAIIIAVFFWGQALGGLLGMMLAVPLTAFFVTAWRLVRRKYLTAS